MTSTSPSISPSDEKWERLTVHFDGESCGHPYTYAFYGQWLIDPGEEFRTAAPGFDAGACWAVARTSRGNLAVYIWHINGRWTPTFETYRAVNAAGLPMDVAAIVAAELGAEPPVLTPAAIPRRAGEQRDAQVLGLARLHLEQHRRHSHLAQSGRRLDGLVPLDERRIRLHQLLSRASCY